MPATPSVNFIMPLSIIDQEACTAVKSQAKLHQRELFVLFFMFWRCISPIKQDAYDD